MRLGKDWQWAILSGISYNQSRRMNNIGEKNLIVNWRLPW